MLVGLSFLVRFFIVFCVSSLNFYVSVECISAGRASQSFFSSLLTFSDAFATFCSHRVCLHFVACMVTRPCYSHRWPGYLCLVIDSNISFFNFVPGAIECVVWIFTFSRLFGHSFRCRFLPISTSRDVASFY